MIYGLISDLHRGRGKNKKPDDFGPNDKKLLDAMDEAEVKYGIEEWFLDGDTDDNHQSFQKTIEKGHPETTEEFKNTKKYHRTKGNHDKRGKGEKFYDLVTKQKNMVHISHGHWDDWLINLFIVDWWNWFNGHTIEHFWPPIDNPEKPNKINRADKQTLKYVMKKFKEGYTFVFCGHTHKKGIWIYEVDGRNCWYVNCGSCQHSKFDITIFNTETEQVQQVRS